MDLIRKIFWFGVFALSTMCFIVLFEHGTDRFGANLGKEMTDLRAFIDQQVHSADKKAAPKTP